MDLRGITAIGVDEMAWGRGPRYVTVVYQIDQACKRLLWIGEHRKAKTLLGLFRWFGKERTAGLRYVCSDMWCPYLKVVAKKAFSSGVVEGLNAKAKVTTRRAYGFKVFTTLGLALDHNLGALPEPDTTHKFF